MTDNGRFQHIEGAGNGCLTLLAMKVADVVVRRMVVGWLGEAGSRQGWCLDDPLRHRA